MPFFDFSHLVQAQPNDYSGLRDIFKNFYQGMDLSQTPQRLQAERQNEALKNALLKAQAQQADVSAQYAPQMMEADLQLRKAQAQREPFVGLTGPAQQLFSIEMLKRQLGDEHPLVKQAKEAYELQQQNVASQLRSRDVYAETLPQRSALPEVKSWMARQDIQSGVLPGTDIPISSREAQIMRDQLDLAQLKRTTDPKTRERVGYAINIDKTLDAFDPQDLVQYAGIGGELKRKIEQGKALTGNESEQYQRYQDALTAATVLAGQIRQFYGESIQPSVREHLEELVNPSTWSNNPKIALNRFNSLKRILTNETGTIRNMLYTPSEIVPKQGQFDESSESLADPLGIR